MMLINRRAQRTPRTSFFHLWLPYKFEPMRHRGPRAYLPLNRYYKPIGFSPDEWVDYGDTRWRDRVVRFASDPHVFKGIWFDAQYLYLYNDNPETRRTYFARLARLGESLSPWSLRNDHEHRRSQRRGRAPDPQQPRRLDRRNRQPGGRITRPAAAGHRLELDRRRLHLGRADGRPGRDAGRLSGQLEGRKADPGELKSKPN